MARPEKDHPLYTWRKAKGMPLHRLAEHVGCTQPHLSEIENGNNWPSLGLAAALSDFTGIEIKAFVRPREAAQ